VLTPMQVPFPALTSLMLWSHVDPGPVIPDTFLGGSAPHLRYLSMNSIAFPGIPKLLLSCTHLVRIYIHDIPESGYFSPEAMATCLSGLTSLNVLSLKFRSSRSRPVSRCPPPMTRFILPNLKWLGFQGASKYLDDLIARIDAPRLHYLSITFLNQMNLNTPGLAQFISRTPEFEELNAVDVTLHLESQIAQIHLCWMDNFPRASDNHGNLYIHISYGELSHEVWSIAQVCTMCLPPLPTVENLKIGIFTEYPILKDDVENDPWLELLRPFIAVKSLHLSGVFQPNMVSALEELVGGRTMEVLPSLQNIFLNLFELSGPFQEAIGQFLAARQLSGHPVAVLQEL
jgi:hypothetical protein